MVNKWTNSSNIAIKNNYIATIKTRSLTTGVDTLTGTGGNDTFVATIAPTVGGVNPSTLTAGDSIDGAGGVNTLRIIDSVGGATQLAGVTLANIQNLTVQQSIVGTASGYNLNGTVVTKATSLNGLSITAGTAVTFTNVGTGAQVVASGSATATNNVLQFSMKTATDAVSVGLDGGVKGVAITATAGTATAATIASTGAANTSAGVTLTGGTNTLRTLAVNAATNLTAALVAADYVTTGAALTVGGVASSVNLGSLGVFKTIDASGLTAGGLTITTGATLTSFIGGAGNNVVTVGANPTAAATITFGAGNDTITGTAVLNSTTVVDGGTGFNTVSAALVNVASAGNIKNFQALDVTGFSSPLDSALLTASSISAIQFSGAAAGTGNTAVIQNIANTGTISVIGAIDQAAVTTATLGSLTVTQLAATPTLSINFNAAPAAAAASTGFFASVGTITTTGDTVVNISSGGGTNLTGNGIVGITDTANTITAINITGAKAFTLGGIAATGVTTTTQAVLTKIDGSTATGNLNITAAASTTVKNDGLIINTGSGNDSITVGVKNATVNGGTGNDKFTVSANTALSDVVNITGGAGVKTVVDALAYGIAASATSSGTTGDLVAFNGAKSLDILSFATVSNTAGALGAKTSVALAATFDQAVFTAESANTTTVTWFQYGGNTYVENSGATVGANNSTDNIVIKLTGLVDLSAATVVTGAAGTITLA